MRSATAQWWARLTPAQQRLLRTLLTTPLASASEIAGLNRRSQRLVADRLDQLKGMGLVDSVRLGCVTPKVDRWMFTPEAQQDLGIADGSWHQPGCLTRLLGRITTVEHGYAMASLIGELGEFREWAWIEGRSLDAACRYENGWVAVMWVGALRLQSRLSELMIEIGSDLEDMAVGHVHPRPSLVCCLAWDRWQTDMALRVAHRLGIERCVRVWCIADETWHGATECLPSEGWIRQQAHMRNTTHDTWKKRVKESLWSAEGFQDPLELLRRARPALTTNALRAEVTRQVKAKLRRLADDAGPEEKATVLREVADAIETAPDGAATAALLRRLATFLGSRDRGRDMARAIFPIARWPAITVPMVQATAADKLDRGSAQNAISHLRDFGLATSSKDGRKNRIRVTKQAMRILAEMDRTEAEPLWRRLEMARWEDGGKFEEHEYGVLGVLGQFAAAGCPVAAAWEIWEYLGAAGGVKPDGAIRLNLGPFGPGWYFLEYELRCRAPTPIRGKLRGHGSIRRRTSFPLLVVCANDRAEAHFQDVGAEMNIKVATTTIRRLETHGAVGNGRCWSVNRQPVLLR